MITDEMVREATGALDARGFNPRLLSEEMRIILETVAPMLIAQGMREAAGMLKHEQWGSQGEYEDPWDAAYNAALSASSDAILARAQEIDPK